MFSTRLIALPAVAVLTLASLGALANAKTVAAPSEPDAPSKQVSVRDLDLTETTGARTALGRIRMAAVDVCGGAPSPLEREKMAEYKTCVEVATDSAVAQLRSPVATAMNAHPG